MGKRHRRQHKVGENAASNTHYENLVKLREDHPQAYERLGQDTHQTVEEYEMSQIAATFKYNPGNESLLGLSERWPEVFALLRQSIREEVERYAVGRRAYRTIYEEEAGPDDRPATDV